MKLSNLMDPRLVLLHAPVASIDAAVESAVKAITSLYPQEVQYSAVLERVRERQRLGGTCFPTGVAIPHARLPDFNDFIIAAVVPKNAIDPASACSDESCAGGAPIRLVWVILVSQTGSAVYLNTLAKLLEASKSETIMGALLGSETPQDFIEVIDREGYEVKKNVTVADIMTRDPITVTPKTSLKELTDVIYRNQLHYLPVVDDAGALVGELGVLDLIKAGIPDYAFRIGSLKFLAELEPMTELLEHEDRIPVGDIMQKPQPIPADSSVVEVAFEMARNKKRHYAVVENGRLAGVVSYMDILSKVLRA